jgi:hypothetical protein
VITWSVAALARAGLTSADLHAVHLSSNTDELPLDDSESGPVPLECASTDIERYLALYEEQRGS